MAVRQNALLPVEVPMLECQFKIALKFAAMSDGK